MNSEDKLCMGRSEGREDVLIFCHSCVSGLELRWICSSVLSGRLVLTVFEDEDGNMVYNHTPGLTISRNIKPLQSSCACLSSVSIAFQDALADSAFFTWPILMFGTSIEWVHVSGSWVVHFPIKMLAKSNTKAG